MKRFFMRIAGWLLGDACLSGTRGCWGRCAGCIRKRMAAEITGHASESIFDGSRALVMRDKEVISRATVMRHDPETNTMWLTGTVSAKAGDVIAVFTPERPGIPEWYATDTARTHGNYLGIYRKPAGNE